MRRAARTDANHAEIIKGLRRCGCSVWDTSGLGQGFPDIVCGRSGYNWLFEIKDGNKPPSARKLTVAEKAFFATWKGAVCVVNSLDEAIEMINDTIKTKALK